MEYVFACDIGTSSLKTALIHTDGKVSCLLRTFFSEQVSAETYVSLFLAHFEKTTKELADNGDNAKIVGICISGNGPSLVAVPKNQKPVIEFSEKKQLCEHTIFLWNNGVDKIILSNPKMQLQKKELDKLHSIFLPRFFLFALQHPQPFYNAQYLLPVPEYLSFYLTGNAYTFLVNDAFVSAYWDKQKIESLQSSLQALTHKEICIQDRLAPFVKTGSIIGHFRGIPVIAGAPDFCMALIGTKTIEVHSACDRAGTSEAFNVCVDKKPTLSSFRIMPSIREKYWNVSKLFGETGALLQTNTVEIEELLSGKKSIKNLSTHLQTYIQSLKDTVCTLEDMCNTKLQFTITGGQAENKMLCQLKANVCKRPFVVTQTNHAELLGSGIVGFTGLQHYRSIEQACNAMVQFCDMYSPKPCSY